MRRLTALAVVVLVAVVALRVGRPDRATEVRMAPTAAAVEGLEEVRGGGGHLDSVRAVRALVRRRIAQYDTYLPAMLRDNDSVLRRWPERRAKPVTVHLAPATVPGYSPAHRQAVVDALTRWQRASDIPVTFRLVRDSAGAEVHVLWIERFPIARTGQADVMWSRLGWVVRGTLTMATHSPDGVPLTPDETYTVALHEIGHLLGLGHSDDSADLMYPSTTIHDLTLRDKRTANLLYALRPGRCATLPRNGRPC